MLEFSSPENAVASFLSNINQGNYKAALNQLTKDALMVSDEKSFTEFPEKCLFEIFHHEKSKTFLFSANDIYHKESNNIFLHQGYIQKFEGVHGNLLSLLQVEDTLVKEENSSKWLFSSRKFKTVFMESDENQRVKLGMTKSEYDLYKVVQRKPFRIILIRHGQSQGNIDNKTYATTPDNKISLTDLGLEQARAAGRNLKKLVGDESCFFYLSPFLRTRQTFEQLAKAWGGHEKVKSMVEPRLREQEWGNFQNPDIMKQVMTDRRTLGSFYYRFPTGESGADVCERVATFIDSLHRNFQEKKKARNVILVTHGLTCRLFLMKWFHWDVDVFHNLYNFDNCQYAIMERQDSGKYKLKTPLKANVGHFPPKSDFDIPKEIDEKLKVEGEERMLKESFSPRVTSKKDDPFAQFVSE